MAGEAGVTGLANRAGLASEAEPARRHSLKDEGKDRRDWHDDRGTFLHAISPPPCAQKIGGR